MKKTHEATHNHKRAGAVVVLQSTGELAQVLTVTGGDTFWVKVVDLTQVPGDRVQKTAKRS
jgi:hypothetical protein